ncbi:MAG: InlB B-repeat-containing protein, partial [Clostridia bacterium]|nr:InlB B-repeat-containing protein [Clostridia bacterium]
KVMTIALPVVSFDANGGTGEMDDQPRQKGSYTVPDCAFTAPGGQQFKCWAEGSASGTQYDAADDYPVTDNVTFYAVWEDIPTDELTGSVGIDGTLKYGQTITATVTDSNNTGTLQYQWLRDGVDIAEANDIAYTLVEDDIGHTLSVVVTSSIESGSVASAATSAIQKADGAAAPTGITATACTTSDDNDGTITGVTAEMEYKLSSAAVWTDGTGAVIEHLAAGTYNVRVKETATNQAGAIAGVVVQAYGAPTLYTVTVIGGIAEPAQAQAGETVIITADDPEEGFVFYGWSSANVDVAKPTRTTTTFVMPDTDVVVVAEYSPVLYSITVLNGTSAALDCIAGETVIITADDPEEGFVFDRWVSDDVELDKPTRTATTFVMPAKNVVVTATYRAASKGGLGAGAIAGIVIAGVAVLAGAGVGALLLIRKKKIA